jgi:hypothetical protein
MFQEPYWQVAMGKLVGVTGLEAVPFFYFPKEFE